MKFTLRDLFNAVFRYSRALAIFWVVTLIVALIFYSQTQKLYESKAKILISLGTEVAGKTDYLNGKNVQLTQREQELHNEQQILDSHEVQTTVAKWILGEATPGSQAPPMDEQIAEARRFFTGQQPPKTLLLRSARAVAQGLNGLFGHPGSHAEQVEGVARALKDGLTDEAVFDSDALDVTFRYIDPHVAQTVLKLVLAAYMEHHISVFQSNSEATLLKSQLDLSVNQYHDRLGAFSNFMTAHRVYNDDAQVNLLIEQRGKLKQALDEAIADNDSALARLSSLKSIGDSLHQFERYSTMEVRNKERDALLSKLNDASVEEQALLTRHPKGSRAYQEEEQKLDELRRLVEKEPVQVIQETEQRKSKAAEFVDSELISLTESQRGDQARVQRLSTDLENVNGEINGYASDLKGFDALKLDVAFAKQESEQMAQVYVDSRLKNLTSQNAITDVSIIDDPTLDLRPAAPKNTLVFAAILLLLLAGSFAVLLGCIGLDTTVADSSTAELALGAPVIGTIPVSQESHGGKDFPDRFTKENHREFARIYQLLRVHSTEGKIILITEANSGEGASLIGYGLARFLSRYAREKTAFVDRTNQPLNQSSALSGGISVNEPGLVPWPAVGGTGPDVFGETEADAVPVLMKLRQEFAYVVVAAGAVKDATDLLMISGIVSAALFIIEAGKTRRASARFGDYPGKPCVRPPEALSNTPGTTATATRPPARTRQARRRRSAPATADAARRNRPR